MTDQIHIIAEAGTNNNGDLQKAKNLVDIAKRAGADSVKFQMINTWGLYLPGRYEYGHYKIEDVIKIRQNGEMTDEEYKELADYALSKGISFSASIFDKKALDLLAGFNPPYIKIASGDLNNHRLLRQIAEYKIKIVLSTGMSTLKDIEQSVRVITKMGLSSIVLLHCVSVYPATLEQTNLSFLKTLKSEFGFEVGFSDHTQTSIAACMALCNGATWFEKHFTENKNQVGLDHKYAMEELELKNYVSDIHNAAKALEIKDQKISENEFETRKRARRSLYAVKDLEKGHILTDADILCVRPENIMQADEIDLLIGGTLNQNIKQYEPFSKDMLK